MFLLAAMMTTAAVAFAGKISICKERIGAVQYQCAALDSNCTNPQCPVCAPFYRDGHVASACVTLFKPGLRRC